MIPIPETIQTLETIPIPEMDQTPEMIPIPEMDQTPEMIPILEMALILEITQAVLLHQVEVRLLAIIHIGEVEKLL